jgi:hypothetical protein
MEDEMPYGMHETRSKVVSGIRHNMVKIGQVRYHNKCNRNQHKTKPKQCKMKPKFKQTKYKNHMAYNSHNSTYFLKA